MKRKSIICVLATMILFGASAMAQKVKNSLVPATAATASKAKYPQAAKVTWEKEKGNFEANWGGKSGEDISVVFTPAGAFVEQVEAISPSALPAAATAYVKTHYTGKKIGEAGKVTHADGNITFEAEIGKKELVFDDKGVFIEAGEEND